MVMALSAAERQSHRHRGSRIHTICNVGRLVLFRNGPTFTVNWMVPVKTRCNELVGRRVGQQVTRELLCKKPVVGHIHVECPDDPVAPAEHIPMAVNVITMCIGIAGQVKPHQCHSLSIRRTSKEIVNNPLVGTRFLVSQKRFNIISARRQSG